MKVPAFLRVRILNIWPQVVLVALALNHMADRSGGRYFIPVFGGDFNKHLVVHATATADDFVLRTATYSRPEEAELAVRHMRHLLEKCKEVVEASLAGSLQLPPDVRCRPPTKQHCRSNLVSVCTNLILKNDEH